MMRQLGVPAWPPMLPNLARQTGFGGDIASSLQAAMATTMGPQTLSMSAALQGLLESFSRRQTPLFDDIAARLVDRMGVKVASEYPSADAETLGAAIEAGAQDALSDTKTETPDEEMLARFYERVLAHLPPAQRTLWQRIEIANFVLTILSVLLGPALWWEQQQHEAKDDREHVQEAAAVAERQEETNRLLQSILEQLAQAPTLPPERRQRAVRETRVYAKPKSGAPVVCRLAEGQYVWLVEVRRKWSRVLYSEDEKLCEGWLRKKYLDDLE
jgi:hypothetical protein